MICDGLDIGYFSNIWIYHGELDSTQARLNNEQPVQVDDMHGMLRNAFGVFDDGGGEFDGTDLSGGGDDNNGGNDEMTNKTNYDKMTMHHTGGTKSFARLRDELTKKDSEGKESDKITMFKATYTKKKDKPTDPTVANAMRQMDELITNQPDASKNEIFNQVIGEMLEDERIQRQTANEKITHLQSELTELKSQLQTMEEMKSQFVQLKSMFEHQFSNSNASS
ncbi:hypothetical protein Q3G72_027154 [Acer saccharum]|nr:hypothetical protein Q3G72_027154 [Acer saccharum]